MPEKLNIKNNTEITYLPGIGPHRATILNKEHIFVASDLLRYYPIGHIHKSHAIGFKDIIESLRANEVKKEIIVTAKVVQINERRIRGGRSMLTLSLRDGLDNKATAVFFNKTAYHKKAIKKDNYYSFTGKPEQTKYGLQFAHPSYRPALRDDIETMVEKLEKNNSGNEILPRYRIRESMAKAGITDVYLRKLIRLLLDALISDITDPLPQSILYKRNLPKLGYAIRNLHFPDNEETLRNSITRMKYSEMLEFQLQLRATSLRSAESKAPLIAAKSPSARIVYDKLPFALTQDQKKVLREIGADFESSKPMNRLLQGDVGAGKTIVALLTILMAVDSGYQAILIAPTEILAEQHYNAVLSYLKNTNLTVELLTGGLGAKRKSEVLTAIANGNVSVIIGTHAAFQDKVKYNRLAYLVIDEQHRFGVEQRASLRTMAKESLTADLEPHMLLMSATPIPRTISLSVYGDLDLSFIKTKPKNRLPIITKVFFESERDQIYQKCIREILKGQKVFMLYPLVDESEKLDLLSVVEAFKDISTYFSDYGVGMVHGKMSQDEKDTAMLRFKEGNYQILVATTVIEVGIDIPEATIMLINHADRFGLSQLHQLRGRVGRGSSQSYCYLITEDRYKKQLGIKNEIFSIQDHDTSNAVARLKVMEESNDGFYISEKDLEMRGPGDILGVRQSGLPDFNFLDLIADTDIIKMARDDSAEIVRGYNDNGSYYSLLQKIIWNKEKTMLSIG